MQETFADLVKRNLKKGPLLLELWSYMVKQGISGVTVAFHLSSHVYKRNEIVYETRTVLLFYFVVFSVFLRVYLFWIKDIPSIKFIFQCKIMSKIDCFDTWFFQKNYFLILLVLHQNPSSWFKEGRGKSR